MLSDNVVNNETELIHFALLADAKPLNYREAVKEKVWKLAMEKELKSIKRNNTWKLVNFPSNKKSIGLKWVFMVKRNPDGSITKHKARLLARGFVAKERSRI